MPPRWWVWGYRFWAHSSTAAFCCLGRRRRSVFTKGIAGSLNVKLKVSSDKSQHYVKTEQNDKHFKMKTFFFRSKNRFREKALLSLEEMRWMGIGGQRNSVCVCVLLRGSATSGSTERNTISAALLKLEEPHKKLVFCNRIGFDEIGRAVRTVSFRRARGRVHMTRV